MARLEQTQPSGLCWQQQHALEHAHGLGHAHGHAHGGVRRRDHGQTGHDHGHGRQHGLEW